MRKWIEAKGYRAGAGHFFAPKSRNILFGPADTLLIDAYNLFNNAIKESRLIGKQSAEYYYDLMETKYPGTSYTVDAQTTLAVEFINFAQSKINLYLDCKDASSIQRLRAQIDEEDNSDEIATSLNRMEKWLNRNFMKWVICSRKLSNILWLMILISQRH